MELFSQFQDMKYFSANKKNDQLDALCNQVSKQMNTKNSQAYVRPSLRNKCELMIQYIKDMKHEKSGKFSLTKVKNV